jgi:para-nitrobenzyl esterase
MIKFQMTRRDAIVAGLTGGASLVFPWQFAAAQAGEQTAPVETTTGKVRGLRANGASKFLGIPYGSDTGKHRFQPARAPTPWAGVRDCLAVGSRAPQPAMSGATGANSFILSLFGSGVAEPESEDCLFLNVYTSDASRRRKRPVMVWLHGGGFAQGSGGTAAYDGSALVRRGDVVVVTLNHRLNAMGYLYLGDLHPDFADSGNVGQLDIILALRWVRDNIAAFGGDPGNVTIFGESGGGAKVGTLLGMPPAQGLFHKAIQESGPVLSMVERADAAQHAEATLTELGIANADVHKLQTMDPKQIIAAATKAQQAVRGRRSLAPVVDGRSLPAHPFEPKATELSRNVPLIIGTCKDEQTLFLAGDPLFGKFTEEQARQRFAAQARDKADAAFQFYRKIRPSDAPTYWVAAMATDMGTWSNSIRQAERKVAQKAAPVYMFRLDWETPVLNGILRAPHGLDTALVFDNADLGTGMLGTGPEPKKLGADMSQAWINFARTGDPSRQGLTWPRYDTATRKTMIFNVPSHVVADPDRDRRLFWMA